MKFLSTSFLFILTYFAQAQVKFVATIEPAVAAKNEYINVSFTVMNGSNVSEITPPSFKGFKIVAGPSQNSSSTNINGVTSTSIGINYVLQASEAGTYTIPAATATVNGSTFKSNSLQCKVTNQAVAAPQQQSVFDDFFEPQKQEEQYNDYIVKAGDNIQDKIQKNLQFKLEVNKKTCYVGEPITASYILNTRLRTQVDLEKNPRFSGFSVIDLLQGNTQAGKGSLSGRTCNSYTIRKVQLYPLQAGTFEIDAAALSNNISFLKYEDAVNNNPNFFNEKYSAVSNAETIIVKPLPDAGKPLFFGGAVGEFDMRVNVEKDSFTTDDVIQLRVEILGSGNMQLVTAPSINWANSFEVFEQKVVDNVNNLSIPVSGSKIFEMPFTVNTAGEYQMPVIEFAYLNPALGKYQTIVSKSTTIKVAKGTGKKKAAAAIKQNKENIGLSKYWWLVLLILLVGVAVLFFSRKRKANEIATIEEEPKLNKIPENTEAILLEPKPMFALPKTNTAFAEEVNKQALYTLSAEFKTQLQLYINSDMPINETNAFSLLTDKGLPEQTAAEVVDLLKQMQLQSYSPVFDAGAANSLYANAIKIIEQLNL
jgi:hypothetical protein